LLNHTGEFIPGLLRRISQGPSNGQEFDVLAAVVDRIPSEQTDQQPSTVIASSESQIRDGSEGVSFVVLDSASAAPDLWSVRAESKERETMTIQQRCTLSFAFPPTATPAPLISSGEEIANPLVSRMLQLPVANTLFQNGKTSTLIAQRWRSQQIGEDSLAISCIRDIALSQQTLRMADAFSNGSSGLEQSLRSYLTPITPTRIITAAIGNIVRRIQVDETSAEGEPASEELEKAIASAIQGGQIPAQQAGVWALVRPWHHRANGNPQDVGATTEDEGIEEAVMKGCRLHKVLSGGGGWGEKQGLLALDPDSDYSTNLESHEALLNVDTDVDSKELQGLGEIVKPGDTVKFFVYNSSSYVGSSLEKASKCIAQGATPAFSMSLGSLPSTMDAMPELSQEETEMATQDSCTIMHDNFGMLSEQGMSLQVRTSMKGCLGDIDSTVVHLHGD